MDKLSESLQKSFTLNTSTSSTDSAESPVLWCTYNYEKLEGRKAVLLKSTSIPESQRELCKKVMTKDFISSESNQEENAGEQRQVLVLRPLRWRSSKIDCQDRQEPTKG